MEAPRERGICVVCLDREDGMKLSPCGHDYFCRPCAVQFRTCPLCRTALVMENGQPWFPDRAATHDPAVLPLERQPVISSKEARIGATVIGFMWLFIFVGGLNEWYYGIPKDCDVGDPNIDVGNVCKQCNGDKGCVECAEGYVNHGAQCFKYIENFPPLQVGAALGSTVYFILIILVQVIGILIETFLIHRLMRRQLMPRKELVILALALILELARMVMVDVFMLRDFFNGREYRIFRTPILWEKTCEFSWLGADSQQYCSDPMPYDDNTMYYIASSREAFSSDRNRCSTFTKSSALLDFGPNSPAFDARGAPRFENLGWALGGEFALFYFFASFINELADIMFVVPTTTQFGWLCKIFSVALELMQLGALCPAAIFKHSECLHYTDPLGVSLHFISLVICALGYALWAFLLLCIPLAIAGASIFGLLFGIAYMPGAVARLAYELGFKHRWVTALRQARDNMVERAVMFRDWTQSSLASAAAAMIFFAFLPLLLIGMFLGILVIVGQSSKQSALEVLTAFTLLADVLLKVGATIVTEIGEYLLHLRVYRAVQQQAISNQQGDIVGVAVGHA